MILLRIKVIVVFLTEACWYFCYLIQVDDKKTVGPEAFARIAPVCPVVADIITAHNLFDALTTSSANRLHFLVYDKYIRSLEK